MTIGNFWAEATLAPSERLRIVPHPLHDQMSFGCVPAGAQGSGGGPHGGASARRRNN